MSALPRVLLLVLFLNSSFLLHAGKNHSSKHKNALKKVNEEAHLLLTPYEVPLQKISQVPPKKNTKDSIEFFQKKAADSLGILENSLQKISEQIAGSSYFLAPLKTKERINEKMKNDEKKPEEILDYARATLCAESLQGLRDLVKRLQEEYTFKLTKNRFEKPKQNGYRDFLVIIFLEEVNFYVEVQITLKSFLPLNKLSHESYEATRVTEALRVLSRRAKEEEGRIPGNSLPGKIKNAFRRIDSEERFLKGEYEKALIEASQCPLG